MKYVTDDKTYVVGTTHVSINSYSKYNIIIFENLGDRVLF